MLQPKEIIAHVRRDFKRHSDTKWYSYTYPFLFAAFFLLLLCFIGDEDYKGKVGILGGFVIYIGLKGLIITSLIIAALSWLFNLGDRGEGFFRDYLISFYKKDNPDWEKEAVQKAGEKIASKYYEVFAWIQIRAVLGMVVLSFLQLLLFKLFFAVIPLTPVVLDFLFVSLIMGNIILYGYFKSAVAHVAYCAETGQDLGDDRIEKQESTGSYVK